MRLSFYPVMLVSLLTALCASCSYSVQAVQTPAVAKTVIQQDISVGIAKGSSSLIAFYAVNNTKADIKILTWGTPFEKILSADIFIVTRDDQILPYLGRKVKRSDPSAADYLLIPAGQTLQSSMDIAKYYGISAPGSYTVTINLPSVDGVSMLNSETVVSVNTSELQLVLD